MKNVSAFVFVLFAIALCSGVHADQRAQPDGFGVADWGMNRNDIIATEGAPNSILDSDGQISYWGRTVLGKEASIIYEFEEGCTSLKTSKCLFAKGVNAFADGSETFRDELEKALTEKYGPPVKVEKRKREGSGFTVSKGKEIREYTDFIRHAGKVKIVHMWQVLLTDYTNIAGDYKAGPVSNVIQYYGPYHYQIELNKEKSKERGL